jgi:peptidoglycan/LPS O-acetylase OafA/YrhL
VCLRGAQVNGVGFPMHFRTAFLDARNTARYVAGCWQRLCDIALLPKAKPPAHLSSGHLGHTPELDGIRGWACGSVVILHCFTGISHAQPGSWMSNLDDHTFWLFLGGVDLFFVLSGFLIGGLLLDAKDQPHFFTSFWIRRVARIFPVLYLLLATYVVALSVTAHFKITRVDTWLLATNPAPLWTYATFLQNLPMALAGYLDNGPKWIVPTWSLSIEEQFYLLFPFAVYFLRQKWLVVLVVSGIVAAPVLRDVIERVYGNWFAAYVLPPTRIDGLLSGVAVALIVRNNRAFSIAARYRRLLDAAALLILYLIVSNWRPAWWPGDGGWYPLRNSLLAIMWAVMILRVFTYERSLFNKIWRNSILVKIGLISYGAYMYNEVVNGLVHGLLFNQEPMIKTPQQLLAGFGVVAITLGLATISYIYFERPIRRYGAAVAKRLSRDSEPSKSLAHAHS